MHQISNDFDLHQLTREPTRNGYLVDLCLSDTPENKAGRTPHIADHEGTLVHLSREAPVVKESPPEIWHLRGAA